MKSSLVLITVSILFILISCNQSNQDSGQTQQTPNLPSVDKSLMQVDTQPAQPIEAGKAEETSMEQKKEVAMLNPAHGQPNHRCDIPVGAPLNSPPNTPQTTNTQVQANAPQAPGSATGTINNPVAPTKENASRMNTPQVQGTSAANTGPKPKTNPAHGQPYHRCDIPVGSPLP